MTNTSPQKYTPKRGVIVVCKDENDQKATYEKLISIGLTDLRVVTA